MIQTDISTLSKEANYRKFILRATSGLILFLLLTLTRSCQENQFTISSAANKNSFEFKLPVSNDLMQINLISEVDDYMPAFLSHAWGIAFNKNGEVCLSSKA